MSVNVRERGITNGQSRDADWFKLNIVLMVLNIEEDV
jgi:hypothetical protein